MNWKFYNLCARSYFVETDAKIQGYLSGEEMGVLILCDGREDNIIQTNGKLG